MSKLPGLLAAREIVAKYKNRVESGPQYFMAANIADDIDDAIAVARQELAIAAERQSGEGSAPMLAKIKGALVSLTQESSDPSWNGAIAASFETIEDLFRASPREKGEGVSEDIINIAIKAFRETPFKIHDAVTIDGDPFTAQRMRAAILAALRARHDGTFADGVEAAAAKAEENKLYWAAKVDPLNFSDASNAVWRAKSAACFQVEMDIRTITPATKGSEGS